MRIQDTDRILKEARYARNSVAAQQTQPAGVFSRAWHAVTKLFRKH
jgi:hypothetical protein